MNAACSSQSGCSRVPFDRSRLGPAEETVTNVFFIPGCNQIYCPQISPDLHPLSLWERCAKRPASHRDALQFAAEQSRWRVIPTNECTSYRSKFGSKENHPGVSRAGRSFHALADCRWCDELDLLRGQNSPDRWNGCVLGHLSGRGIFCALLYDRLRAVAASTRAAEGDVGTEARGVFAGIALPTDEQSAYSRVATGNRR